MIPARTALNRSIFSARKSISASSCSCGIRTTGAAFCLSGAGPTLLCITRNPGLQENLEKKLHDMTEANWALLPLHIEFNGAHVIEQE